MLNLSEPDFNCPLCPRLVEFRRQNSQTYPKGYNGPVLSFGDSSAELLIIGLAPGLQGANMTGRPFTGDYAGELLYNTLKTYGFMQGSYQADPDDGIQLKRALITNAVRCVPPQNKPVASEIKNCRPYLVNLINNLTQLKAILCLGRIAHETLCQALNLKKSDFPFKHGQSYPIKTLSYPIRLYDSYHCSRYNTNTRRLTAAMFETVFQDIKQFIDQKKNYSSV